MNDKTIDDQKPKKQQDMSRLGLQKTVIEQGKRIAALENVVNTLIDTSNDAMQRVYLNTLCCQFLVEAMTPEQEAEFQAFLEARGVAFEGRQEQQEESRIVLL